MSRKVHSATRSVWMAACLLLAGCGGQHQAMTAIAKSDTERAISPDFPADVTLDHDKPMEANSGTTLVLQAGEDAPPVRHAALANRKIIYNTTIGLVVESYAEFESQVPILVQRYGGFVASNRTNRSYQIRQSGTWTIRIPVDQYAEFLSDIHSLGFAESRNENAQDVTEEFVDIQARIKNKKQLEQRVLSILEDRTGKLTDVLEIERELSRVREEIERMEGRMRYLADRTSLATVTIDCREEQEYLPAAAPTLGRRIALAWSESIGTMRFAGENLLVAGIALTPWLAIFAISVWLAYRLSRKHWPRVKPGLHPGLT